MLKVEHCLEDENGKQAVKKAGKHCQKGESDRQKGEADVGQAKSLAGKAKSLGERRSSWQGSYQVNKIYYKNGRLQNGRNSKNYSTSVF